MEDKKKQRRRYRLHYNLRRKGNTIVTGQMWCTKRAADVTPIERKWLAELVNFGYCVCDGLFYPPPMLMTNF